VEKKARAAPVVLSADSDSDASEEKDVVDEDVAEAVAAPAPAAEVAAAPIEVVPSATTESSDDESEASVALSEEIEPLPAVNNFPAPAPALVKGRTWSDDLLAQPGDDDIVSDEEDVPIAPRRTTILQHTMASLAALQVDGEKEDDDDDDDGMSLELTSEDESASDENEDFE
jgi:hypothetical protein